MVLDHLYNPIGKANAIGVVGEGSTSFSTSLYYQSTFPAGIQEAVLVLYAHSNANGSIAAAVIEKVLVNGALERTFAVESVDLAVTPNSIAGMTCGSKVTFTYTATFHIPMGSAGELFSFSTPGTMDAPRLVQVSAFSLDRVQLPIALLRPEHWNLIMFIQGLEKSL